MNNQGRKICLITTNHISTNPRLVKEAIALQGAGYKVHLVLTQFDPFLIKMDEAILLQNPGWTFDVLDWSGTRASSKVSRISTGILKKIAAVIVSLTNFNVACNLVLNRNYYWQVKKAMRVDADLYLAHNLGALPVARFVAEKKGKRLGFDAEDFHRNEMTDDTSSMDFKVKSRVEQNNLPRVDHFTAASPLIGEAYKALFPGLSPTIVVNVFPKLQEHFENNASGEKLKLFWFSQTIGDNRGIEEIIAAVGKCAKGRFELHLLGKTMEGYRTRVEKLAKLSGMDYQQIIFHNPVPESEIFVLAAQCDIGMASETGVPHNRDICLTNKIFTYVQSGLAVLATDTKAQVELFERYPCIGKVYNRGSSQSLVTALEYYEKNPNELRQCKKENFDLGQTELNWEAEQNKFLACMQKLWHEVRAVSKRSYH